MIHRLLHLLSLTIFFSLVIEGESREKRIFTISKLKKIELIDKLNKIILS